MCLWVGVVGVIRMKGKERQVEEEEGSWCSWQKHVLCACVCLCDLPLSPPHVMNTTVAASLHTHTQADLGLQARHTHTHTQGLCFHSPKPPSSSSGRSKEKLPSLQLFPSFLASLPVPCSLPCLLSRGKHKQTRHALIYCSSRRKASQSPPLLI